MKLKNYILLALAFTLFQSSAHSEVYILEGVYQGKDLYVQNPFADEGVGFCVFEVLVNGEISSDEINSSAFAVDLAQYEFSLGDDVIITIRSKADCSPKIINPEAISPTSSCSITDIALNQGGMLEWSTKNENGKLPFIIEHFKWNKWVQIGSVLGNGTAELSNYSVKINLPSGENKIRLKQKDYNGERITDEVTLKVEKPVAELISHKVNSTIDFSEITHYELFNSYGELVKTGFNSSIDVSDLDSGIYFLNYELTFGVEIKKK